MTEKKVDIKELKKKLKSRDLNTEPVKSYTVGIHRKYMEILQSWFDSLKDMQEWNLKDMEAINKAGDYLVKELFGIKDLDDLEQWAYDAYRELVEELRQPPSK